MVVDRHEGGGDHVIELPVFVLGELANGEEAREIRMCPHLLKQGSYESMNFGRTGKLDVGLVMTRSGSNLALLGECLSHSEDLLPSESSFRPHSGNGLKKRGNH